LGEVAGPGGWRNTVVVLTTGKQRGPRRDRFSVAGLDDAVDGVPVVGVRQGMRAN